jgi:hypothetical protein
VRAAPPPLAPALPPRPSQVGFLGIAAVELATQQSALAQLSSPVGAAAALGVAGFVLAASVAPAVAGRVPAAQVSAAHPTAPVLLCAVLW